eukprot:COSAG05_NODE_1752_length_4149_cov_2.831108_4_plen_71_part_00
MQMTLVVSLLKGSSQAELGPAAFVPGARVRSTAAANRVVVDELQQISTNCVWYTLAVALRPSSGCVASPR